MTQKISGIFDSKKLLDTTAYNELSPKLKDVIGDLTKSDYKMDTFVSDFEGKITDLSNKYNVDSQEVYDYIERETNNI